MTGTAAPYGLTCYFPLRRCPGTWWAPPPSKRVSGVIPHWRVRFPSTSAFHARLAAGSSLDGEEVARAGVAGGMAQLRHGARLDLADALAGEVEVLAHLF